MSKQIRFLTTIIFIGFLGSINSGCSIHGKMNGLLLDSKTGKPIQGAAVVVVYYAEHGSLGGASYAPEDATEITTGQDGKFSSRGKRVFGDTEGIQDRIYIFEPNHEFVAVWMVNNKVLDGGHIVSVSTSKGMVYEFRLSRLETESQKKNNAEGVWIHELAPIAEKFPNFMRMVNAERHKYGIRDVFLWNN
jgi:hypothetical protein